MPRKCQRLSPRRSMRRCRNPVIRARAIRTWLRCDANPLPPLALRQWMPAVPKRRRCLLQCDTVPQGQVLRTFLAVVQCWVREISAVGPARPARLAPACGPPPRFDSRRWWRNSRRTIVCGIKPAIGPCRSKRIHAMRSRRGSASVHANVRPAIRVFTYRRRRNRVWRAAASRFMLRPC